MNKIIKNAKLRLVKDLNANPSKVLWERTQNMNRIIQNPMKVGSLKLSFFVK